MNNYDKKIKALDRLILESMGVSQTVVDVASSIIGRLIMDAKKKSSISSK